MKIGNFKIWEFFKESNGTFSSTRLFTFLIIFATIIDWMHAVLKCGKVWEPSWQEIALICAAMGWKVAQKFTEEKKEDDSKTTNVANNQNQNNPIEIENINNNIIAKG